MGKGSWSQGGSPGPPCTEGAQQPGCCGDGAGLLRAQAPLGVWPHLLQVRPQGVESTQEGDVCNGHARQLHLAIPPVETRALSSGSPCVGLQTPGPSLGPAHSTALAQCGPQSSPDAHGVLHPGFLLFSHLGGLPPAAAPPSIEELQGRHGLGTGPRLIPGWKVLVLIVLVVLICFHCTGTALWLRPGTGPSGTHGL